MIYLIRASHANDFELQNYKGIKDLQVVTSQHPLTKISLPQIKLWSPTDLPVFPFRRQILNRLIGGEQWLLGIDKLAEKKSVEPARSAYSTAVAGGSIQRNVVHTAETFTPYTHQAVQLRKQGKIAKLICTCWETISHNNEKFSRLRKWKSEACKYVDIFHTPTERAKQALIAEGVDPTKITVIPYGVDLARFTPHLPGVARKARRPVVLTVARLEKEKGMETLERVASQLPQYDFQVIGNGTYAPRGNNITIGSVPYSQIHRIYQRADLFFLPSITTPTWEEQYGMSQVEAMACGLPIVTTSSGGIPEVVGNAGIIVDEKNVDKMVKSIHDILSNPDIYKQHSKLSLARAKSHFDSRKIAQVLSQLYQ